ncbi:MAG: AAA family ATPase, partial [Dehalococcoidales bacterium]|nr:AAA family ATPase [Dehalococcoidales bacterium]
LEFPVVFIVGMEDGILPHFKSIDDPAQLEEERRLCYVGITRAKQRVYLVRAFRRHLMGSSAVNRPSRFLQDIPSELITTSSVWEGEDSWVNSTAEARDKTEELKGEVAEFKPGDHVRHEQFGEGVVVSYQTVKNDAEVVVAFDGVGVKRFLLSFAKIEKV